MSFQMYDFILKKRRGGEHTQQELFEMIRGYTAGEIPDYQVSAWAMAVCFQGMTDREAASLTRAMAESGDMIDLSPLGTQTVDKHSTGGVGDKTTPVVIPIVAACGARVAKMSGRGLGHTGGTVDKLEAIPGYRTEMGREELLRQAERVGAAVVGQSANLTPADKKLYALRDVTATVDSIPLIAASIMSKKLAAGARNIVLDVKYGSGAFFSDESSAAEAASLMVRIGQENGRRMSAVLSDMDTPLGYAIGNALEIREAASLLAGADIPDLCEVSLTLATEMLSLALCVPEAEARQRAEDALFSGAAFHKLLEWVEAQGGDPSYLTDLGKLPVAAASQTVCADRDGFVSAMESSEIGMSALLLGAGRRRKEDRIDPGAGILLRKKTGDAVRRGDVLAELYGSDKEQIAIAAKRFSSAVTIGPEPKKRPLIGRIIR
jgi:pyrimidine-nucleoside phosphorylase